MLKSAMAIGSALAITGQAYAQTSQTSATLYGVIDGGFNFTSNAGESRGYQLVSGDTAGRRWGD
jgi:predicted porin